MKQQITRLSPHQNAKVAAVMMAVTSLIILVPIMLIANAFSPAGKGVPLLALLLAPLFYLVVAYISTVIGCAIYNALQGLVGGIEYESRDA